MKKLAVHVHGAGGKMGKVVTAAVSAAPDLALVGTTGRAHDLGTELATTRPDVLVDFTVAEAGAAAIALALQAGVHVVSGTTGISAAQVRELGECAKRAGKGLVLAANFALGVVLLQRFAALAAKHFAAVEILELHHDQKRDAPSGTALTTARRIAAAHGKVAAPGEEKILVEGARGAVVEGVHVHSVRLPGLVAHQEVLFGGIGQVLTLRHDALDRTAYVPGILLAIRGVVHRKGLLDSIEPLLDDVPKGP